MHLVHWFEIPVNDMDRARQFYETVFEIEFVPMKVTDADLLVFPIERGSEGSTGALILGDTHTPSHDGSTIYFSVDSIEKTLQIIEEAGGEMLTEKTSISEYGYILHFEDSEGNKVALHSMQ